ncbi:hypothetical protein ONZ45_g19694 [Pleurotus djamor]|nr:hypothetical protein ONZ45_g19694 [Pleurotus djamor]
MIRCPPIAPDPDKCADRFYFLFANQQTSFESYNTAFTRFLTKQLASFNCKIATAPNLTGGWVSADNWRGGMVIVAATENRLLDFNTLYERHFAQALMKYMCIPDPVKIVAKMQINNPLPSKSPTIVVPAKATCPLMQDVIFYLLDGFCPIASIASLSLTSRQFSATVKFAYARIIELHLESFLGSSSHIKGLMELLSKYSAAVYGEMVVSILKRSIRPSNIMRVSVPCGARLFFTYWFYHLGFEESSNDSTDSSLFDSTKAYTGPNVSSIRILTFQLI